MKNEKKPEKALSKRAAKRDAKENAGNTAASSEINQDVQEITQEAEGLQQEESPGADNEKNPVGEANDKYIRCLAEFDNYRKRTEKEKSSMYSEGAKFVILNILPILDNFERALKAPEDTEGQFYKGVDMIYKQLKTSLESMGVSEIESLGKIFDTNIHNAIMHIEDDSYGENEIVEELQKGYMYKDKVIRYSMVKVAN